MLWEAIQGCSEGMEVGARRHWMDEEDFGLLSLSSDSFLPSLEDLLADPLGTFTLPGAIAWCYCASLISDQFSTC